MDGNSQTQPFGSPQSTVQAQVQKRRLISIGDLFSKTWQVYKSRLGVLVGIMAIDAGFYVLFLLLSTAFGVSVVGLRAISTSQIMNETSYLLLFILLISIFIIGGSIIYSWLTMSALYVIKEREQKLSIGRALRKGWSRWVSYLWISSLVGLCVVGGVILLIIPGIIFFVWFAFSQYLLADQDIKGTKALSQSKALIKGYWWPVFGRLMLIILITMGISMVLGLIPFIGNLFIQLLLTPFVLVFYFVLYEDLKRVKESSGFSK